MTSFLKNRKIRNILLQGGYLIIVFGTLITAIIVGRYNLETRGITSGFAFLDRATGFDVAFSLIEFGPYDSFGKMLWVGLLNTMFLGALGIVFANIIGLIIALFRTSENAALNLIGTVYVESYRNIPMILQDFFWYAVLTHLPTPQQAYTFFDAIYISSRGIYLPGRQCQKKPTYREPGDHIALSDEYTQPI